MGTQKELSYRLKIFKERQNPQPISADEVQYVAQRFGYNPEELIIPTIKDFSSIHQALPEDANVWWRAGYAFNDKAKYKWQGSTHHNLINIENTIPLLFIKRHLSWITMEYDYVPYGLYSLQKRFANAFDAGWTWLELEHLEGERGSWEPVRRPPFRNSFTTNGSTYIEAGGNGWIYAVSLLKYFPVLAVGENLQNAVIEAKHLVNPIHGSSQKESNK